jgi:hypothetical protein
VDTCGRRTSIVRIAFVVGAPRSGTTLLRVMLAGHPDLFVPPEMILAPFETMAERKALLDRRYWEKGGLRRALIGLHGIDVDEAKAREEAMTAWTTADVYRHLGESGRMIVDKCPHLAASPAALARLARTWPEARWIWIVRHPGSVLRSVENMPMAEVLLEGYAEPRDIWRAGNEALRSFLETIPADRQCRIHYEDLVTDPRPVMERACAALGVPFHEAVLDPYEGDRMRDGPPGARAVGDPNMAGRGRIQPELATKWLDGFDADDASPGTAALAATLGYDLASLPPPPIRKASDALRALLGTVERIEREMRVPGDIDKVEGRRFLLRQLSHALDLHVEAADPDHPRFEHAEGPHRKSFADNPDADYWRAPLRVDAGQRYRVWGCIPEGAIYVGFLLYGKGGRIAARTHDRALALGPDGSFELIIGADTPLLPTQGDETAIMVRQYFVHRDREPAVTLHIERIGAERPTPLSPADLARAIERSRRNLEVVHQRTVDAWKMASAMAYNRFVPIGGEQLFPTPDNQYLVCWYRLGPDQKMVVRGRVTKARYWSIVLYNLWMESLDYTASRIHLNHGTNATDAEGRFAVVVAHRDPGVANWLDTMGHLAGYALIRVLLPEEPLEPPTAEIRYESE